MKKKYNFALIPTTRLNDIVILANEFAQVADSYLLGPDSIPHVTLCKIVLGENQIESCWQKACDSLHAKSFKLDFMNIDCGVYNHQQWISLLPKQSHVLHTMHNKLTKALSKPINKSFDPHLTLVNTKNKNYKVLANKLAKTYQTITDNFIFVMGESDEVGQLTKIVCQY